MLVKTLAFLCFAGILSAATTPTPLSTQEQLDLRTLQVFALKAATEQLQAQDALNQATKAAKDAVDKLKKDVDTLKAAHQVPEGTELSNDLQWIKATQKQ
jgi:hypothetical protein